MKMTFNSIYILDMKITGLVLWLFTSVGVAIAHIGNPDTILNGSITLERTGTPVRNANITIAELNRTVQSDENGRYEFIGIPTGKYQLIVHLERMADAVKIVSIDKGKNVVDFELKI